MLSSEARLHGQAKATYIVFRAKPVPEKEKEIQYEFLDLKTRFFKCYLLFAFRFITSVTTVRKQSIVRIGAKC